MARNTGPVCRICRRLGDKLYLKGEKCFTPKCPFERRPYPPGQRSLRRRKVSDRGLQLREKQKGRAVYGVLERQFQRYYAEAARRHGITGDNLLKVLELRLDNVVYRLGFGQSRAQARQLVRDGHITVNGRKASTPSHVLKVNDGVGLTEKGQKTRFFESVREEIGGKEVPSWLKLDPANMTGQVVAEPVPEEVGAKFSTATIVEYYSR
ncbi:MAG: 30S ribosomal protein S4 [Chloroflexi bacterium]|nr:30S ribosomal protein S4 [Chloroflexota bacterium]